MFKKVFPVLFLILFVASVGFAAPLADYSAGKVAIDVMSLPNSSARTDLNVLLHPIDGDGKSGNFDWGLTAGLGNKFALQYRQYDPETYNQAGDITYKTSTKQLNLLYQLDKNLSVFAGYHRAVWRAYRSTPFSETEDKGSFQGGIIASTKVMDKLTAYTVLGFGSNVANYELGLSYAVSPNVEVNVEYRDMRVKGMAFKAPFAGETITNSEFRGIGYGLTFKF